MKTKTTIKEIALKRKRQIIDEISKIENERTQRLLDEGKKHFDAFEEDFKDYIPLIKDINIKYQSIYKVQHTRFCIQFEKNGRTIDFDYIKAGKWRYYDNHAYGYWPKEDLAVMLYDAFIKPEERPTSPNPKPN